MGKLSHEQRIEKLKQEIAENFNIHKEMGSPCFWRTKEKSFEMYGKCGCHETLMDQNCTSKSLCQPYHPEFIKLLDKHNAWPENNDGEGMTIHLND